MKQFTMALNNNFQRPVVLLKDWKNYSALIDTGADIPVWVSSREALVALGGRLVKRNLEFYGFANIPVLGDVYKIKGFVLGQLIFNCIYVVVHEEEDKPYDMILSATIFRNLIYEIDDKHHKLNVTIPDDESPIRNLIIEDSEGYPHILVTSADKTE